MYLLNILHLRIYFILLFSWVIVNIKLLVHAKATIKSSWEISFIYPVISRLSCLVSVGNHEAGKFHPPACSAVTVRCNLTLNVYRLGQVLFLPVSHYSEYSKICRREKRSLDPSLYGLVTEFYQIHALQLHYTINVLRCIYTNLQATELLLERCMSTAVSPMGPGDAMRRFFEALSSGICLPGGPGLSDPCEKDPVDAFANLNPQTREILTSYSQVWLSCSTLIYLFSSAPIMQYH